MIEENLALLTIIKLRYFGEFIQEIIDKSSSYLNELISIATNSFSRHRWNKTTRPPQTQLLPKQHKLPISPPNLKFPIFIPSLNNIIRLFTKARFFLI